MDASQANSMLNSFDEEMEDFELEVSHREGTQLITFILPVSYTHLTLPTTLHV